MQLPWGRARRDRRDRIHLVGTRGLVSRDRGRLNLESVDELRELCSELKTPGGNRGGVCLDMWDLSKVLGGESPRNPGTSKGNQSNRREQRTPTTWKRH